MRTSDTIEDVEDLGLLIDAADSPTVLLEGTRSLPNAEREELVRLAQLLARRYPAARFRTGNASGADEAFAEGVAVVDPTRLEYVLPTAGMRRKSRVPGAYAMSLRDVPEIRGVAQWTNRATPRNERLVDRYLDDGGRSRLSAKAAYLLRDTVKVVGSTTLALPAATAGVFYANPSDPMKGGTGHTIRVCRDHGVPVVLADVWRGWLSAPAGQVVV